MPSASVAYGSVPFAEQIQFFRSKRNVLTESYLDVFGAEHDRAFMVAGANRDDLVADFRAAIDKAIADGATLADFRKDFDRIVAQYGWGLSGRPQLALARHLRDQPAAKLQRRPLAAAAAAEAGATVVAIPTLRCCRASTANP